jgi:hypothetical protein
MRSFIFRLGALGAVVALALAGAAAAVGTMQSPARDSFAGHLVTGTGAYAGYRGSVSITLVPNPATGDTRPVVLLLRPLACRPSASKCMALRGRATGTIVTQHPIIPDVGMTLNLITSGSVRPLGQVHLAGTIHTVGFIARGRETLRATMRGARGGVTVLAISGLVPGFTSP